MFGEILSRQCCHTNSEIQASFSGGYHIVNALKILENVFENVQSEAFPACWILYMQL